MELLEHFKDTYHRENERTKNINDGLSIPIGIITLLATGVTFYVSNFDFTGNVILTILFLVFVVTGAVFLGIAIYDLHSAYDITIVNPTLSYKLLPTAEVQEEYYDELKQSYIHVGQTEDEAAANANEDLCAYLQGKYIEYSSNNLLINDKAEELVTRSKRQILMALIFLIVAFIPYSIHNALKPEKASKTEIVKSVPLSLDSSALKSINHVGQNEK